MSKPRRNPKPLNNLRHTAIHEAGHATIGRVLTLVCGGASIVLDYEAGEAGHALTADHFVCESAWQERGKVRGSNDAVLHGRIITFMAGVEAEAVILGSTRLGDGHDREQIKLMAEELSTSDWDRREPRLRAMTRMLVRRHRHLIECVAETLVAKDKLTAKQLDRLVGRSVEDVKVNAPMMLLMRRGARDVNRPRIIR